jgi:hypothetical protein
LAYPLLRNWSGFASAVVFLFAGCFTDPINMSPTVRIDAPLDPIHRAPLDPIPRGLPVTYTATVSDPDSDSVSLQWERVAGAPCPQDFDAQPSWPTSGWNPGQELDLPAKDTTSNFCVWVKATDRYGASAVDARTGDPQDQAPVAVLELVAPPNGPSFPAGTMFTLSAEKSTDPDPGDTQHLSFSWTLKSSPSQTAALLPCAGNVSDAVRCLAADAAGDYQVEVRVVDDAPSTMDAIVDKTLHVLPGQLPVAAIDLVDPAGVGPYPLGHELRVSAAHSTGANTYTWGLEPPAGSALTGTTACDGDTSTQTQCFVADVPGTYRVKLTAHNETGDGQPVTASYVVAPDQPPCLDHTTPDLAQPVTTADDFVVDLVSDDLNPFPAAAMGMGAGMQWFLSEGSGPFMPVEKDFPSFSFNPAAFSFGDVVRVRLEIQDRDTERSATEFLACGDADVCSAPSLIHPDACIQRVTWTVNILP